MSLKDICDICGNDDYNLGDDQICPICKEKHFKKKRYSASDDVKAYRALAKMFDGKALTGTAKQKEWGEALRAEFIEKSKATDEVISKLLSSDIAKTATFWIDNREYNKENLISDAWEQVSIIIEAIEKYYSTQIRERIVYEKKKISNSFKEDISKVSVIYPHLKEYVNAIVYEDTIKGYEHLADKIRNDRKARRSY